MNPFLGKLDPGFYNYGSLALLVNSLCIYLAEGLGLISAAVNGLPSAGALLTARLVTACLGAGTCLFLYGTGRLLFGPAAGLAAAGLYAIAPLAVQHGHFATVDVPATFWIAGALFFAARHLAAGSAAPGNRDLFWMGIFAGLAAATKYNAGLVLLAGLAAWRLKRAPGQRMAGGVSLLLGGALLGFVVGCPGVLLNPQGLVAGIAEEARHVREGHGAVFLDTPPSLVYHALFNLRWGLGAPLLAVTGAALAYAAYRRRAPEWMLLAFTVPYYLLIGFAEVKFARYTLPLFPPLLLLAGALLTAAGGPLWRRRIAAGAGAAAAGYALLFSLALDATMSRPDPRDQAAAFVREAGFSPVGFATGPWFFSPPLQPLLAAPVPRLAQQAAAAATNPRLIPADGEWNTAQLRAARPPAVAVSEFEYADALRTGSPAAREYLDALRGAYPRAQVFGNPVQVYGLSFTNLRGNRDLPVQGLPHDMLYTNPTTVIWHQ